MCTVKRIKSNKSALHIRLVNANVLGSESVKMYVRWVNKGQNQNLKKCDEKVVVSFSS